MASKWERDWEKLQRNLKQSIGGKELGSRGRRKPRDAKGRYTKVTEDVIFTVFPVGEAFNDLVWANFFEMFSEIFSEEVAQYVQRLYNAITGGGGSASRPYWPEVVEYEKRKDSEGNEYKHRVGTYTFPARTQTKDMGFGIAELGKALSIGYYEKEGFNYDIKVGPGGPVFNLKLHEYMGTTGKHRAELKLDSLFYAVIFGTGVQEKVGGEPRTEGDTKDPGDPGSWWLGKGKEIGTGLHFLGQLGISVRDHFLWAPRIVPGKGGVLLPSTITDLQEIFFFSMQEAVRRRFGGAVQISKGFGGGNLPV